MGIPRGLVLAVLVAGTLSGQQASQVFSFREAFAILEGRGTMAATDGRLIERLRRLVSTLLQHESMAAVRRAGPRERRNVLEAHPQLDTLLVSGTRETVDLVAAIHEQLGKAERRELNVQCSVLTLPRKLATAHGIGPVAATPMEEAAAGALIKETIQAKGTLRNLPEAKVEPFVPFSIGARADGEKRDATPQPIVRGEALLIRADEALLAMQVGWPEVALGPLQTQRRDCTFRCKAGSGVMLMGLTSKYATEDEPVIVLWVRFAGVTTREPEKQDAGSKPRDK